MSSVGTAAQNRAQVGRNDPCPCGSGRKFKHCCERRQGGAGPETTGSTAARAIPAHVATVRRLGAAGRWEEAIPVLREIARLDPASADAHHDLGITCLRRGQLEEAVTSLRRAVELRPRHARALAALADALEQQAREAEAAAAYRRAGDAASSPAARRTHLGKALMLEGRLEEAARELQSACALAPADAVPSHLLGQIDSQRGRFAEAQAHLVHAIELAPDEPHAFADYAMSRRMDDSTRPLLARMQVLADRHDLSQALRTGLHFGLGKSYDDLGEYRLAIGHYDEANRLKARSMRLDRAKLARHADSLIAGFSAEGLRKTAEMVAPPEHPDGELPVLVLGMPRSGTTLVEQVLSSHPAVAAGGELPFWKHRVDAWTRAGHAVDRDAMAEAAEAYRALLRRIGPEAARVIDKAPGNFQRIWLFRLAFPNGRIVHCRRHPVDTCLSIYFTHFLGLHEYAYDRGDLVFYYRQYRRLMAHWRSVLPPDRFMEVDYERLVTDQEAVTRELVAFCGLPWSEACLAPERNKRAVRTASHWQARQPVYATSMARWRRYEPWLGELRALLDEPAP